MKNFFWVFLLTTNLAFAEVPFEQVQPPQAEPPNDVPDLDPTAGITPKIIGIETLRKMAGISPEYDNPVGLENVKVAIIDSGFAGFKPKKGLLPASAILIEDYRKQAPEVVEKHPNPTIRKMASFPGLKSNITHGLEMAQAAWAATNNNPNGPEFHLLNGNEDQNVELAIEYCIQKDIKIIGYSHTKATGSNFRGRNSLAAAFNRASKAGIIVAVPSGNYGELAYSGPVIINKRKAVLFKNAGNKEFLKFRTNAKNLQFTFTLVWEDTSWDQPGLGTDRDLDLVIYNKNNEIVDVRKKAGPVYVTKLVQDPDDPTKQKKDVTPTYYIENQGQLKQTLGKEDLTQDLLNGVTRYARERITVTLDKNDPNDPNDYYRIRVWHRGGEFADGEELAQDKFKILITQETETGPNFFDPDLKKRVPYFEFPDYVREAETLTPQDGMVLVVGNLDAISSEGTTADGRSLPHLRSPISQISFDTGKTKAGTSYTNGFFVGIIALLLNEEPDLTRADIKKMVESKVAPIFGRNVEVPQEGKLVSMDYLKRNYHPSVIRYLEKQVSDTFGSYATTIGRLYPDYRLGMDIGFDPKYRIQGYAATPAFLKKVMKGFTATDLQTIRSYQYFVNFSQTQQYTLKAGEKAETMLYGHWRALFDVPNDTQITLYPWEREGNTDVMSNFLQLREVKFTDGSKLANPQDPQDVSRLVTNLFKMPKKDQLPNLVSTKSRK